MYYLQSRYYDPEIRRFISADSVIRQTLDGVNLYAYCGNDPVNRADPSGHSAIAAGAGYSGYLFLTEVLPFIAALFVGAVAGSFGNHITSRVNISSPPKNNTAANIPGTLPKKLTLSLLKQGNAVLEDIKALALTREPEFGTHRHHIVPQKDNSSPYAQMARDILLDVGINPSTSGYN